MAETMNPSGLEATAGEQWQNFRDDPEWQKAFEEFNKDGRLVAGIESVFMRPTSYSPIK